MGIVDIGNTGKGRIGKSFETGSIVKSKGTSREYVVICKQADRYYLISVDSPHLGLPNSIHRDSLKFSRVNLSIPCPMPDVLGLYEKTGLHGDFFGKVNVSWNGHFYTVAEKRENDRGIVRYQYALSHCDIGKALCRNGSVVNMVEPGYDEHMKEPLIIGCANE